MFSDVQISFPTVDVHCPDPENKQGKPTVTSSVILQTRSMPGS